MAVPEESASHGQPITFPTTAAAFCSSEQQGAFRVVAKGEEVKKYRDAPAQQLLQKALLSGCWEGQVMD